MCDNPKPPDSRPGDHGDCAHDTEACPHCGYWRQDHMKEVARNRNDYLVSSQHGGVNRQYRFEARLATGDIRLTVVLKWGALDTNLTEAHKTAVKNALKTDVAAAWSNKHSVKVTDPICGEKTLPIKVRVLWNPDDTTDAQHYSVDLSKTPVTSSIGDTTATFDHDADLNDNAWTLKHEFGHILLLPDEYFYSGVTSATIDYKRANGTSERLTLEPGSGIMQVRGDTTVEKRHMYFAEIEAQELLRAKSGRNVICETV